MTGEWFAINYVSYYFVLTVSVSNLSPSCIRIYDHCRARDQYVEGSEMVGVDLALPLESLQYGGLDRYYCCANDIQSQLFSLPLTSF